MDKRILLPTDYSKNAFNAIKYALGLYANVQCDFYILNAYQVSGYTLESMRVPEEGEPLYEAAKKESEEGMERLLQILKLQPENHKHRFHTICTFNSFVEAVDHAVRKNDIDAIVMGTKGVTGSMTMIFGTNTVRVMEQIKQCPVIAVPNDYLFVPPKEIVFPTDFRNSFQKKEIRDLMEIANLYGSRINVVHMDRDKDGALSESEAANKKLLEDILDGTDYEMHFLPTVKLGKGIEIFLESIRGDMVAFLNRKHTFLWTVLSNPLVKEIGYDPKVPILELNDN
ncbi:Nucleotide-binding universal stress protein, UspA family [Flagellimonas taeanensis]|uniref:Nucleotide-binding universal stress protein, UspA family n=1 Tax=Flagellimonas taeanensis TaxID=1005926 RepID=A0A1M6UPM7_9FLAO|nr:universal stress protein [Allomuricauda taeanensis]SFC54192.1 Nucleotide-binding universal stress protein, UspA family [Allomuricauda taeanensis]SHK71128.1 Nucleotide-binding universal stress protein, UspA family [Allomuricauda taeanensis]